MAVRVGLIAAAVLPSAPRHLLSAQGTHSPTSNVSRAAESSRSPDTGHQQTCEETDPQADPQADPQTNLDTNLETLLSGLVPASDAAVHAVPQLIAVVQNRRASAVDRQRAAMMLGRIGPRSQPAVDCLVRLLDDTTSPVWPSSRSEVPDANHSLKHRPLSPPADVVAGTLPRYWALKGLGLSGRAAADVVARLSAELADAGRSPDERILLADVLGQIGTGPAIQTLARQLQLSSIDGSTNWLLRQAMVDAIGLGGPDAVVALPVLIRSTSDLAAEVRRSACHAIGGLGPRAELALESVVDCLVLDDNHAVRDAAASALVQIGSAAGPILIQLAESDDVELQWRAAHALGQMGPAPLGDLSEQATGALINLSQGSDARVRIESLEAAAKLSPAHPALAAFALREISEQDRTVRFRAARLLVRFNPLPSPIHTQLERLAAEAPQTIQGRTARWVLRERSVERE